MSFKYKRIKLKNFVLYALLSTLTMAGSGGCRKDVQEFVPYDRSVEALREVLAQVPDPATFTEFHLSMVSPADITLTTPGSVRIILKNTGELFANADGVTVPCSTCTDLKVEVTEVLARRDLLARGLSTFDLDGNMLNSGGAVHLRITCDGQELHLLPGRDLEVQLPVPDAQDGLLVYYGEFEADSVFSGWSTAGEEVFTAQWTLPGGQTQYAYQVLATKLGWVSCNKPVLEPTTQYCVSLPPGFNAQNTLVFVMFTGQSTVTALEPDSPTSGTFCLHEAPLGYPVKIITLSKVGGQFSLDNLFSEIGTNANVPALPEVISEQDLIDFLKGQ
jgi:hypothetical protein